MSAWFNGQVVWSNANRVTDVAQISTQNQNGQGSTYWWRNLLPGETLHWACQDFFQGTLNLPSMGVNCASFIATEWTPTGDQLVQQREFDATTDEVNIFSGD